MQIHFTQQFPWGKPTNFIPKVWNSLEKNALASSDGYYRSLDNKSQENLSWYLNHQLPFGKRWFWLNPKPHTIREDKTDRWKPGKMIHFVTWTGKPYRSKTFQFAPLLPCVSVQKIRIHYDEAVCDWYGTCPAVFIDERALNIDEIEQLAKNDGFDSTEDFLKWFDKDFTGKIIHWTNLKY